MESKGNQRYLQFPLFLIRDLLINKNKTLNDIIVFGIYRYSKQIDFDLCDVAKQLTYCYYRHSKDLTGTLLKDIQCYLEEGLLSFDEDYNGFSTKGFEFIAESEIEDMLTLFETNPNFKEQAIEFFQIKQAYSFLQVNGDFDHCLKVGKEIESTIPLNEPYPSINKNLIFEFRDKEKSNFDLIQFVFYISIRSIIGQKEFCKTNKKMILNRAFGYGNKEALSFNNNPDIKNLYDKYNKRYHIDRILQHLQLNWDVIIYSYHIRGLYVGMKNKISLENMIMQAEMKKKKNQIDILNQQKQDAREKALQQLNKKHPL